MDFDRQRDSAKGLKFGAAQCCTIMHAAQSSVLLAELAKGNMYDTELRMFKF